jgi:hypothetical protein
MNFIALWDVTPYALDTKGSNKKETCILQTENVSITFFANSQKKLPSYVTLHN